MVCAFLFSWELRLSSSNNTGRQWGKTKVLKMRCYSRNIQLNALPMSTASMFHQPTWNPDQLAVKHLATCCPLATCVCSFDCLAHSFNAVFCRLKFVNCSRQVKTIINGHNGPTNRWQAFAKVKLQLIALWAFQTNSCRKHCQFVISPSLCNP